VFTRAGQTNLVRSARSKGSVVDSAPHRFYHSGDLVGEFGTMPGCSYFTTKAGSPYSVSFMFGPSNETQSASVDAPIARLLAFECHWRGASEPECST
jgi:hypothetical protein